ncbi:hypothetical protein GPB2148_2231 [marine gamma proteobacterium HTCC2148]|nr:hypothetical protein GPB2148_2231 [marine gamma proteobacterium HTCC2148]
MNYSVVSELSVKRKLILLAAVFAVALSWTGYLDQSSDQYLNGAIKSGGLVYATARGINAAVSLLMGTEITPAIATFSVGQVLDPINDLIERFSAIMLVALGSLALQKILLEIFSNQGFSILVTGLGVLLLFTAFSKTYSRFFSNVLRFFTLTIAIRFALSLVVLASAAVDHNFLRKDEIDKHDEMKALQGELQALSTANPGAPTTEEIAEAKAELASLQKLQSEQQKSVDSLREEYDGLYEALERTRSEVPITCRLNPWCDEGDSVNAKKLKIVSKEAELNAAESVNNSTLLTINEKREYLKCARRERAGESCSFWGRAYSFISPTAWIERFSKTAEKMNDYASNIISLLMSLLIKTVLIPLLFLYTLIQVYKRLLSRLIEI